MSNSGEIRRVYFVGAGLSAGLGYPTGASLVPMLIRHLCGFDERGRVLPAGHVLSADRCTPEAVAAVREGVQRLLFECFRVRDQLCDITDAREIDKILGDVDLAEFFTVLLGFSRDEAPFVNRRLDWEKLRSTQEGEDPVLPPNLYDAVASVVRSYFFRISQSMESREYYPQAFETWLRSIDASSHAIVSYNWDEEIDYFLDIETQGFAYTYQEWVDYSAPKSDKDMYLLLKPHGSIGWYNVAQGLGNKNLQFVAGGDTRIPRERRSLVYYTENELPLDLDGEYYHHPLNCPPAITPPTYAKDFEFEELRFIWHDVIDVCSNADEFVFLGYSLPADDFWTRAAVRMALAKRRSSKNVKVVVVSKSLPVELELNYRRVFGDGFRKSRNFIDCDFSKEDDDFDLGEEISKKMRRASVN